ncbi:MAG: hypothetical protein RXQ80_01075 [Sulfolobaceae archaeon]|nr:hypothetical protein [Stygiolobus sp.]PVU68126.1 hypothetical protein DDW01_00835 [Sulfolobus sp. SCGC AB-777_G05]
MSVKFQKIDKSPISEELAKIAELIYKAEELHEENGIPPTTDFTQLFEDGKKGEPYFKLYLYFADKYSKFISNVLREFAVVTNETRTEFISILLDDGNYLILEGEEDKVTIPHPSAIASTHTHPDVCLFSHKDLETADYLFIRNYLTVGVISPYCLTLIYRKGVYTMEDKIELEKLANKVKKSKRLEEVVKAYGETSFINLALLSVRFV